MGWMAENLQKLEENIRFFGILGCLKRWLKHFFGDVGAKMAFSGILGALVGQVGAKMANKTGDANMRGKMGANCDQDGPR